MPRNALTIIKECYRDFFSKHYKTEVYDSTNASFRMDARYRLTVYAGAGILRFDYVSGQEIQIHVIVPQKGEQDAFYARYLNYDNESVTYIFNRVKTVLAEAEHSGKDIDWIIDGFRKNLPAANL